MNKTGTSKSTQAPESNSNLPARKTEKKLQKSQERFRQIYEHMTVGVAEVSRGFFIKRANDAYCNMLGYDEKELIGKHLKDITHPEILAENLLKQEQLAKGEIDHYRMEKQFIHKNGHTIHGVLDANAVRDKNGRLLYFLGTVVDITYQKKVETELKSGKQLLEGVFDSIKDVIGVQLPDRTMLRYNRAGYELLGLAPEEIKGRKCYELIGRKAPCRVCATSLSLASKTMETVEKFIPELQRHFLITSNPVLDENNDVTLIIEQLSDITEQKNRDRLLRRAQKMESIGALAGGIAHDFNNILFPITGLSELLMDDLAIGSNEYANAQEIFKAGIRGSQLVKQILAFSRQSEHKMLPTRIQSILKEALKLSRATLPANIEIKKEIQSDCGMINADATRLHQVIMNIITNAYHAMEKNGGRLTVRLNEMQIKKAQGLQVNLLPGRYALLSFSDTGHGMSEETLEKIFDPYFTTKEQGKGTGLGLAVVHGIVKEHKGEIKVFTRPGKGTTFNIYLPLMAKTYDINPAGKTSEKYAGTERILLVDDELPIASLEGQILSRLGYQVTTETDSENAINLFKADPGQFDLVISDMSMPRISGDQLAKKVLRIRPDIPVIICTGFSEKMNPAVAENMGIKGFLMKPITISDMAKTVRKILDDANKNGRHTP